MQNALEIILSKLTSWKTALIDMLPNFMVAVLVLVAFYFLAHLVRRFSKKLLQRVSTKKAVNNLFSSLFYLLTLLGGLIISLNVLHLEQTVTSLLAGAGIIGLALSFAFQDISANFISGVIIAFRKPVKLGDTIEIEGNFGQVESIDLRTTTIQTFQGLHVIIPNRLLIQNPLTNYSFTATRRIDLEVGISYGEDLASTKKLVIDAIKDLPFVVQKEKVNVFYTDFDSSSINFTLVFWIDTSHQMTFLDARSDAIITIKNIFDNNDITIPFPIRTLDFGIKGGKTLDEMTVAHKQLSPTDSD